MPCLLQQLYVVFLFLSSFIELTHLLSQPINLCISFPQLLLQPLDALLSFA